MKKPEEEPKEEKQKEQKPKSTIKEIWERMCLDRF